MAQKHKRPVSPIPAYQRIEEDIREKVRDGRLPPGAMLASRHNLAKEYSVSLSTVQQSIANLIADGTLESYDRRGTFVAHTRPLQENGATAIQAPSDANHDRAVIGPLRSVSETIPTGRTSATLGIVATSRVEAESACDVGSLWTRMAIRSLEYVFSAAGGTSHYFDLYPDHLGPYATGYENVIPLSEAIAALRAEGAKALVILGMSDPRDMSDEILAAVDVEHVPTVYISWHPMRPPLAQVFYDSRFAGYQAAQHLLRKGYRRVLFFAPCQESWLAERIEAAQEAARHARLPSEALRVYPAEIPLRVYDRNHSYEWTYALAQQVFREDQSFFDSNAETPWGIIAPNDLTAYAVLQAATEQGKTAGKDYGLVGFDDDERSYSVGLTTVRPPVEAMGAEAGRLLLQALRGEKSGLQVRLRSQVIPRTSTSLRRAHGSSKGFL